MKRFAWFVTKKKRWFYSYIKAHQVQNTPELFNMHQNNCLHYFQCTYSLQEQPTHHPVAKTAIVQFSICRHPKKRGKTLAISSRGQAFFRRLMSRSKMLPGCETRITDAHQCAAPMGSGLDWTSWVNMGVSSDTNKGSVLFRSKRLHSHTGPKQPKSNFFIPLM